MKKNLKLLWLAAFLSVVFVVWANASTIVEFALKIKALDSGTDLSAVTANAPSTMMPGKLVATSEDTGQFPEDVFPVSATQSSVTPVSAATEFSAWWRYQMTCTDDKKTCTILDSQAGDSIYFYKDAASDNSKVIRVWFADWTSTVESPKSITPNVSQFFIIWSYWGNHGWDDTCITKWYDRMLITSDFDKCVQSGVCNINDNHWVVTTASCNNWTSIATSDYGGAIKQTGNTSPRCSTNAILICVAN